MPENGAQVSQSASPRLQLNEEPCAHSHSPYDGEMEQTNPAAMKKEDHGRKCSETSRHRNLDANLLEMNQKYGSEKTVEIWVALREKRCQDTESRLNYDGVNDLTASSHPTPGP
jgi:hypothetical protein